jgi:hypothetical protein
MVPPDSSDLVKLRISLVYLVYQAVARMGWDFLGWILVQLFHTPFLPCTHLPAASMLASGFSEEGEQAVVLLLPHMTALGCLGLSNSPPTY